MSTRHRVDIVKADNRFMAKGMLVRRLKLIFSFVILAVSPLPSYAQDWLYAVRPGDTLWDLCLTYTKRSNCWQTIGEANNVEYARRIPPGTIIKFPIDWLKVIPEPVTITFFRGQVSLKTTTSPDSQNASFGKKLAIGTTVVVGEKSAATLKFADGSILTLDENSELELDALSANGAKGMVDSRLRLKKGSATTRVPERENNRIRFQIETPGAVAAVRGTNFRVSAKLDENNVEVTQSEVIDGAVDVATSVDNQLVNRGFGIIVNRDQEVPAPVELLPAPEWKNTPDIQMENLRSEWQGIEGASEYKVELLSDSENADVIESDRVNATRFSWDSMKEQCYKISVRAIDSQTLLGLPAVKRICVEPLFAGPDLEGKLKKTNDHTLQISWQAIDRASSYEVELATDAAFTNVVSTLETAATTVDLSVTEKTTYFARVRGINSAGARSNPGAVGKWTQSQWDKKLALFTTFLIIVGML